MVQQLADAWSVYLDPDEVFCGLVGGHLKKGVSHAKPNFDTECHVFRKRETIGPRQSSTIENIAFPVRLNRFTLRIRKSSGPDDETANWSIA